MNNIVALRDVVPQDLPALASIYVSVYEAFDVGENWDVASAQKLLEWNYKRNPDLAVLAEIEGEIVGAFMVAVKPWWDGNHLVDGEIFVAPDHQKEGIGTLLIEAVFTRAKEKYQVVGWDTYTFRLFKHPLAWYESLGFSEVKEWMMISGSVDEALEKIKQRS